MPWLSEAKKGVTSCEKLRGLANTNRSADTRMGQPILNFRDIQGNLEANVGNWNITLPTGKENNNDSRSSGERNGKSPNQRCFGNVGVVGLRHGELFWSGTVLEKPTKGGDSPVHARNIILAVPWVRRDTRNPVWNCRDHPVRLNTSERPIANKYREGKVKSTPNRGVK